MPPQGEIRLSEAVSLFVLEEEGVFFDEARQELFRFNTPATFLWCCLEEGLDPVEVRKRYAESFGVSLNEAAATIERQLREWQRRGYCAMVAPGEPLSRGAAARLLLANPLLRRAFSESPADTLEALEVKPDARTALESIDPLELEHRAQRRLMRRRRRPTTESYQAPPDPGRATLSPLRTSCKLTDTEFRLTYPRALAELVRDSFGHLPGDGDGEVQIEVRFSANGFTALVDGTPEASATDAERVVPMLKDLLRRIAVDRCDGLLALHAGVVLAGDHCLLLPAAAGSGKSLLTAALLKAGCGYFSDELAVLERGSLRVRPVPLSLAIKEGGVAPLEGLFPGVADLPTHLREDGKRVRYLAPPNDGRFQPSNARARWIVFPAYQPDGASRLESISAPAALRRMLDECVAVPRLLDSDEVEDLVRWIAGMECRTLTYRSLAEAVLLLRGLLSDRQTGSAR